MASIFSFQEEPPRIHSPWSTPGATTPRVQGYDGQSSGSAVNNVAKLEPERQEGPCEYKLHLLLRPRRKFMSMSTTSSVPGSLHSKPSTVGGSGRSVTETLPQRPVNQPSSQTRQARLQQLTTQLLWRLQQSSPFHSSSNADLILPVLPEATPRLGVPERPAKLLPGLEESQGALYEIGVADDGTLVGLIDNELEESLTNLRAMAASLGCVVDTLRRVCVGSCEWAEVVEDAGETRISTDELLVAEVLVRPDSRAIPETLLSPTDAELVEKLGSTSITAKIPNTEAEQMRVAFAGASTAGKSSLVGTLTTSTLDNGRGKSRLSLLKHRHEIASGVTSSVAQELVGYEGRTNSGDSVINYASGDVSSWTDIHSLADRLVFLSDSPGLSRYAKSTFRTLISWKPNWTVFCIAADDSEENVGKVGSPASTSDVLVGGAVADTVDLSLAHLGLCLRLKLPLLVSVTKMDLATKSGLRAVLGKVLSALKSAGRRPVLLSSPSSPTPSFALEAVDALPNPQHIGEAELDEVQRIVGSVQAEGTCEIVPIIMTSAVSGSGVGKLHALLKLLPILRPVPPVTISSMADQDHQSLLFSIDEVFSIPPSRVYSSEKGAEVKQSGIVLCGHMLRGRISVGDKLCIGPFLTEDVQAGQIIQRAKSHSAYDARQMARSSSGSFGKSYQDAGGVLYKPDQKALFMTVRVVSLRNLRLPVLTMHHGDTGTVGIEPLPSYAGSLSLQKARKGMVLIQTESAAFRSLTASFPSSDFSYASSPPLILGGHAIVYVNSIRAAVKVTAVALAENDTTEPSPHPEVFAFDAESDGDDAHAEAGILEEREIKITFRFGSTVEWLEIGDQVLVVPTVTASGPVTGPPVATLGLSGFVGRITDVYT